MSTDWSIRDKITGRMLRQHREFSLNNFNDGWVDNNGRFRVYYPKSKRAYKNGTILRSIAAYELYHGETVQIGYDIHHINGNKLDDSKDNLALVSHEDHTRLHHIKPKTSCTCSSCGIEFKINMWRLKEKGRGKYCSQECYRAVKKTKETKQKMIESRKWYKPSAQTKEKIRAAKLKYWEKRKAA